MKKMDGRYATVICYCFPYINNIANVFVYMFSLTSFKTFVRENSTAVLRCNRSARRNIAKRVGGPEKDVKTAAVRDHTIARDTEATAVNIQTPSFEMRSVN
jgi:hypothetical protein